MTKQKSHQARIINFHFGYTAKQLWSIQLLEKSIESCTRGDHNKGLRSQYGGTGLLSHKIFWKEADNRFSCWLFINCWLGGFVVFLFWLIIFFQNTLHLRWKWGLEKSLEARGARAEVTQRSLWETPQYLMITGVDFMTGSLLTEKIEPIIRSSKNKTFFKVHKKRKTLQEMLCGIGKLLFALSQKLFPLQY